MRHTCVTLNFDTGMPAEEINEILAHYRARTTDQAAAVLQWRLDHKAKGAKA